MADIWVVVFVKQSQEGIRPRIQSLQSVSEFHYIFLLQILRKEDPYAFDSEIQL